MSFDFEEYIRDNFDIDKRTGKSGQVSIDCINEDCEDIWKHGKHRTVNFRR